LDPLKFLVQHAGIKTVQKLTVTKSQKRLETTENETTKINLNGRTF